MGKIGLIARREFNERVRKKSFIITTILMPVCLVGIIGVMAWLMTRESDKIREIIVVDESGVVAPQMTDEGTIRYRMADQPFERVREEAPEGIFGILLIGDDIMTNSRTVQLYTYESSTVMIEEAVAGQIRQIVEAEKLKAYHIDNLDRILAEVETPIVLQTKEITESGETRDSSSTLALAAAYIFGMLVYMFVFLYGTMVMQGVIEEKSNKVLELMVSSVKPFQLMMGKIIGIASVALTQLLIWVVFIALAGGAAVNFFAGDAMTAAAAMNAGEAMPVEFNNMDMDGVAMLSRLTDVRYILTLVIGFVVYFIGGYLLYAAMFAAVGSAVDNEKDTQNLQLPITIPLILAFVVMVNAMQDPHSHIAFWFSMIPFTSPIIMMARLPYGVPMWEVLLSAGLLYATFVGMVWLAGKIYRVGIFMYGKKPSFRELFKWVRYKY
jgi:ABC-2 type transport system permease protein